jgi:hypothetical protein
MQLTKELFGLARFLVDEIISPEGVVVLAMCIGALALPVPQKYEILKYGLGAGTGAAYSNVKRKVTKDKDSAAPTASDTHEAPVNEYEENM